MSVLAAIEEILEDLLIVRYISAAGLTILIYDHVLSFPDEIRFIWSAKGSSSKFLFLALRYLVPCMMITHSVQIAGLSGIHLSNTVRFCKAWWSLAVVVGWLVIAINNWLVLLRLWVLWGRDRTFIICTLLFFFAMHVATLVLAWISVSEIIPNLRFEPSLQLCIFTEKPGKLPFAWVPGILFEFLVLLAAGWKVFLRPQTLKTLKSEGFLYFLLLFTLNLVNMLVFFYARLSLIFVTLFFMWCFTTTATCRMILSIRSSSEPPLLNDDAYSDDSYEYQFPEIGHRTQLIGLVPPRGL
ncbi:hypothetical protein C8R44DRAFT_808155 [Mycena epipterygia]|nr:hypothetical protein C8R44DRAFT_808155 [Mycena epipterygia]